MVFVLFSKNIPNLVEKESDGDRKRREKVERAEAAQGPTYPAHLNYDQSSQPGAECNITNMLIIGSM